MPILTSLGQNPPQTLLVEGGTEKERLETALRWAQILNCEVARADPAAQGPCGICPPCRQIAAYEYLDLHIYDGRIANKADEENPGLIRALTIDNMRDLKARLSTAPHGEGKRVAIFLGMIGTREEALNSLLKTLEEPAVHTCFVLSAPQREQLLPTLVSRSLCLTLAWPGSLAKNEEMGDWEKDLGVFLENGRGFLDNIAKKGALDTVTAGQIIMLCQRALVRSLAGGKNEGLAGLFAPLAKDAGKALQVGRWIGEAQLMLASTASPARVLEGFCSNLFVMLRNRANRA